MLSNFCIWPGQLAGLLALYLVALSDCAMAEKPLSLDAVSHQVAQAPASVTSEKPEDARTSPALPAEKDLNSAFELMAEPPSLYGGPSGSLRASEIGITGRWNHNGSIMRMELEGNFLRILYVDPRPAMRRASWRPGDVLFQGRFENGLYTGTAWLNSSNCGLISYEVNGEMEPSGTSLVLRGDAPRRNFRNCTVKRYALDVLRFDRLPDDRR